MVLVLAFLFPLTLAAGEAVRVGYLPVTGHAKYFVAKELGLFEKEGLDVELIAFQNSMDGMGALRAGKIDTASFGASYLVHIAKGADIRVIGGIMGGDASVIARPDSPVKSLSDLKGLKVATVRMATGDVVLRWALKKAGLDWRTDVKLFELRNPPAVVEAVKNGQVDAGVVWGPVDLSAVEQGLKIVMSSYSLYPGHPCCRLTVQTAALKAHPQRWQRFMRAILLAEKYAREHREDTIRIIGKYVNLSPALLEKAYYSENLDQTSDPNSAAIRQMWGAVRECGFVESDADITAFIDCKPYQDALESLARENPDDPYWKKLQTQFAERNP